MSWQHQEGAQFTITVYTGMQDSFWVTGYELDFAGKDGFKRFREVSGKYGQWERPDMAVADTIEGIYNQLLEQRIAYGNQSKDVNLAGAIMVLQNEHLKRTGKQLKLFR